MATIHVLSLNERVVNDISCKKYSEEQLISLYESLNKDTKSKKTAYIVVMCILTVLFLGNGIYIFGRIMGFPGCIGAIIGLLFIVAFIGIVTWYAAIGKISMKWNKLISTFYPELREKCKL